MDILRLDLPTVIGIFAFKPWSSRVEAALYLRDEPTQHCFTERKVKFHAKTLKRGITFITVG